MEILISSFCMVFLLGLQQQNVTHEKHLASLITGFLIAFAQTSFIREVVSGPFLITVLLMGAGGGIGASLSILVHKRFIRRSKTTTH